MKMMPVAPSAAHPQRTSDNTVTWSNKLRSAVGVRPVPTITRVELSTQKNAAQPLEPMAASAAPGVSWADLMQHTDPVRSPYAKTLLEHRVASTQAARRRLAAKRRGKPWTPRSPWRSPNGADDASADDTKDAVLLSQLIHPDGLSTPRSPPAAPAVAAALRTASLLNSTHRVRRLLAAEREAEHIDNAESTTEQPTAAQEEPQTELAATALFEPGSRSPPARPISPAASIGFDRNSPEQRTSRQNTGAPARVADAEEPHHSLPASSIVDEVERIVSRTQSSVALPRARSTENAKSLAASWTTTTTTTAAGDRAIISDSLPSSAALGEVRRLAIVPVFAASTQTEEAPHVSTPRSGPASSHSHSLWATDDEDGGIGLSRRRTATQLMTDRAPDVVAAEKETASPVSPTQTLVPPPQAYRTVFTAPPVSGDARAVDEWTVATDDEADESAAAHDIDHRTRLSMLSSDAALSSVLHRVQQLRRRISLGATTTTAAASVATGDTTQQLQRYREALSSPCPPPPHVTSLQLNRLQVNLPPHEASTARTTADRIQTFFSLRDDFFARRDSFRLRRMQSVTDATSASRVVR